ncbi:MAG: threonylcarbamoyl-AMP synthase [Candidatus Pacebacteria bacterium]|nr:threonylcarbamoyl-AMP synthase [Candidatus Paceibacterota bacterium]MBP9840377.1 threonylcarbamoyl-AMP synthase [Candidatus Paceibacterota bacterium]
MEILKVSDVGVVAAARRAAAVLARGGLIVYPTDTLYGIGVNALDGEALNRLRTLKAREAKKPVSVLASSVAEIEQHAELSERAREIAKAHMPGAITLVVPAKSHIPEHLTFNGTTSFRIPDDAFARALAEAYAHPVTATSANMAGMDTETTVMGIVRHFADGIKHIDLLIDDGPREGGVPSTVISVSGDVVHILREGVVSREALGL